MEKRIFHTSQKIIEMRFFDLILGDFIAAPTNEDPVNKIPLKRAFNDYHL
jgi:hypothetical protein